jgi:hypothetical protein
MNVEYLEYIECLTTAITNNNLFCGMMQLLLSLPLNPEYVYSVFLRNVGKFISQ